jgi:UDP-N-acetylglucosamine--N-acetylmuramyl-(pentapeptide) pyrophosphoryl-undecaprenol N-acetylglucosamine transferase
VSKRALIAAGGTGWHFYPGFVVAEELRRRGWEVCFLVRRDDPVREKLDSENLPYVEVDLRGLPRSLSLDLLKFPFRLLGAQRLLNRVVKSFKPDLAVGMGGYLTFPLVAAARFRGVPAAIHESNSVLGLANKASCWLGASVFWGLPPRNAATSSVVVGTPIRPSLLKAPSRDEAVKKLGFDPSKPVILVFGGSQGAAGINAGVPLALRPFAEHPQVYHIAGRGKADETRNRYGSKPAQVLEYTEDMATAYAAADLVICRSGASTLAELAALKKPAVLVPYPHATDDHQTENAKVFDAVGVAELVRESELGGRLGGAVREMLESKRTANFAELRLPEPEATVKAFVDSLERL